jgi:hypothetical protein
MSEQGREALGRVVGPEGGVASNEVWAAFRSAVAHAMAELHEAELGALRHWQDARHQGSSDGRGPAE